MFAVISIWKDSTLFLGMVLESPSNLYFYFVPREIRNLMPTNAVVLKVCIRPVIYILPLYLPSAKRISSSGGFARWRVYNLVVSFKRRKLFLRRHYLIRTSEFIDVGSFSASVSSASQRTVDQLCDCVGTSPFKSMLS